MSTDKNYEERKHFLDNMNILSRSELEEIFRMIRRNNDIYSENTNGIFFDVSALRQDTFIRLKEYMNYCLENRNEQEHRNSEMNTIRSECITNRDIHPQNIGFVITPKSKSTVTNVFAEN